MALKNIQAFMDLLEQSISPDDINMCPELKALVDRKWDSYGLE